MEATTNWGTEMGELPRSLRDYDYIKAFVTSPVDKFRVPYAKKAETYPRLTSFCATTNSDHFLKEDTERRFWVVLADDIDLDALNQVCFESVWAEAYELFRSLGQQSFRLTKEEREKLREENAQYRIPTDEEKLLLEKLDWEQPRELWKEFTATTLCELVGRNNVSPVKVGKALKLIGYSKDSKYYQMRIKDGYSVYLTPSKVKYAYELTSQSEEGMNSEVVISDTPLTQNVVNMQTWKQ